MQTLDAPVYEVRQDSEWYKETVKRDTDINNFFKEINEKYFTDNGFSFYHSEYFGISGSSKDYETYKDHLLKNPEKNGMYPFKKRSKYYPIFKEMIEKIDRGNPFKAHDVLGLNNVAASQWLGDRWFYQVKRAEDVKDTTGAEVTPIEYVDYLSLVMTYLEPKGELK